MAKKTVKTVGGCLKEFCGNGATVFPFCPGCMTLILTVGDMWTISKTIKEYSLTELHHFPQLAEKALSTLLQVIPEHLISKPAALSYFVSINEEMANLLNHRWCIFPLCHTCADKKSPEFYLISERHLALSRRFMKFRNVTEELRRGNHTDKAK